MVSMCHLLCLLLGVMVQCSPVIPVCDRFAQCLRDWCVSKVMWSWFFFAAAMPIKSAYLWYFQSLNEIGTMIAQICKMILASTYTLILPSRSPWYWYHQIKDKTKEIWKDKLSLKFERKYNLNTCWSQKSKIIRKGELDDKGWVSVLIGYQQRLGDKLVKLRQPHIFNKK